MRMKEGRERERERGESTRKLAGKRRREGERENRAKRKAKRRKKRRERRREWAQEEKGRRAGKGVEKGRGTSYERGGRRAVLLMGPLSGLAALCDLQLKSSPCLAPRARRSSRSPMLSSSDLLRIY